MNSKSLLFGLYLLAGAGFFQKFYLDADKTYPTSRYAVVMDNTDPNYIRNLHLDGNLDGKITIGETERAYNYTKNNPKFLEMFDFAKSLNSVDRRLVQGLTYDVAKKAVVDIPLKKKYEYIRYSFDPAVKVNEINAMYRK